VSRGNRANAFDCVGMASDSTTDEQACRRDRRGPGGAPAAKRGRTTLTPRSSGTESIRLSCRHVQCRWCRTKISHPREGEEGAGSAAQACLRRVARHGAFRATPDGLNHLDGVATSKEMGALPLAELASGVSERHAAFVPWRQRISPSRRP
jgi:hypothetical protein